MMLGSADAAPSAPAVPVVFLEDLPEGAQAQAVRRPAFRRPPGSPPPSSGSARGWLTLVTPAT